MATVQQPQLSEGRQHTHGQLSAVAWGLLFVWVGVAALLQVGWGYGLVGAGVIILGSQVAHQVIGEARLDVFSTIVGLMFLVGGVYELFSFRFDLVPILLIVSGVALAVSAFTSRPAR